jgi:death-on-curing protein
VPTRIYLTVAEVLTIHKQQIDQYGGIDGLRDSGLLESAIFRPQTGYYNSVAEESAALMESLANNHPFLDGNKRVAFAAARTRFFS